MFSQFLIDWAEHLRMKSEHEVVSMDGKTLRGNAQKQAGLDGLHLLNAWSFENGICLGQMEVGKKTNEIKVIPKLIKMLDQFESKDDDHGRVEHRLYSVLDADDLPVAKEWEGMQSVGRVIRRRTYGDRSTFETCYYIMSLEIDAKLFAHAVRGHWGVENNLHWSLDVIFREDHNKYRDRVEAQNLIVLSKKYVKFLLS
jgi:predicted transposase YbfD/YdcC